MTQFHRQIGLLVASLLMISAASASAQFSGSRGGLTSGGTAHPSESGLRELPPEIAQGYIMIDGQVELRTKPTEIRIVLAVTAEAKTPAECHDLVNAKIEALTADWKELEIPEENIVEDFISVLPRYEFEVEKVHQNDVAMEKKAGYLMQSNLHLAVQNDAEAMQALTAAFENGVADIIAFDYWSRDLDELKVKARAEAVKAARTKADVLLDSLFEKRPAIINVQEQTRVYYPESLYESFSNSAGESYQTSFSRRDIPQIRMFRPKNTYYRGLNLDSDVRPKALPMQSEISVVSTVRLYFASPAARPNDSENSASK